MKNSELSAFPHPDLPQLLKGLTKREYAAIMAMQGYCSNMHHHSGRIENIAKWAIQQADDLLSQLEQKL